MSAISASYDPTKTEIFSDAFDIIKTCSTLRLNSYPAQSSSNPPALDPVEKIPLSCETHTDKACLTILYQDHVGGLQVCNSLGKWIDVPTNPAALVCNIGFGLQRLLNDTMKATNHRVLYTQKQRFSIPFFLEPHASYQMDSNCIDSNKKKYDSISYADYIVQETKVFKEYRRE